MASVSTKGEVLQKSTHKNDIFSLVNSVNVKARFESVLHKNAGAYLGSVLNVGVVEIYLKICNTI